MYFCFCCLWFSEIKASFKENLRDEFLHWDEPAQFHTFVLICINLTKCFGTLRNYGCALRHWSNPVELMLSITTAQAGCSNDVSAFRWRERVRVILRLIVSQYVLASSPLCGRLTRCCFLFKSLGLEFVILSLWGALSDERSGLSFLIVRVTLRLTVSQSVRMSWCRAHVWTFDQILLPFQEFRSGICCPVSVGRPLWREARSVLCKSQSSHLSVCKFTIYIFVFHIFTILHIYTGCFTTLGHNYIYICTLYIIHIIYVMLLLVPARNSRLRPTTH
jgi:hypothetical protein